MNNLMEEWLDYRRMVLQYSNVNYNAIEIRRIEKMKARTGGCVYFNNHLFGIANSSREVLDVDMSTCDYEMLGKSRIGTFKWTGGCLYKDRIYGFPRKENSLLVIDPFQKTVSVHKLNIKYRGEHHYGGICTTEGILYQPPRNTNHILCIDFNTFTTRIIQMFEDGVRARYSSAIQHPDGSIYLIPEYGFRIAVVHPETEEIEYFGEPFRNLVFGVVIGYDGNIYGYSKQGKGILKIDTKKNQLEWICEEIGNPDCYGAVVGINGRIYGVPGAGKYIWELDIEGQRIRKRFEIGENGYAHNGGGGIGRNGTICMMPCFGNTIYYLKTDQEIKLDESMIRNRFFNTSY